MTERNDSGASVHAVACTPGTRLYEEPATGHNRWHESVPPLVAVDDGDTLVLDTRDGFDGQVTPGFSVESFDQLSFLPNHPMTGPVAVRGAEPGDLLEVQVLDVEPDPVNHYGFTLVAPGFGLLREQHHGPYVVHWDLTAKTHATSPQIPGVRIPYAPFCGIMGTAPSGPFRREAAGREAELAERGYLVLQPDPVSAIPAGGVVAAEGLRTIPPRENGGNLDIKQLTAGSSIFLPVLVPDALFSVGDAHFAQGDGETCGTAIEMRARVRLRFEVHRGAAQGSSGAPPVLLAPAPKLTPRAPRLGTVGLCVETGRNHSEDLTLAAKGAAESMIRQLERAGYSALQAYVIVSIAADLVVSQAVDVPNVGVTALLDLSIFDDGGDRLMSAVRGR